MSAAVEAHTEPVRQAMLPLGLAVVGFLACVPLVDVLNGVVALAFGESPLALGWKMLMVPLLAMVLLERRTPRTAFFLAFGLWTALAAQLVVPTVLVANRITATELAVLGRGPILMSVAWLALQAVDDRHLRAAGEAYFKVTWVMVTVSIVASSILGIGLATYQGEESYGAKGFYVAGNEVTFTYVMSWWFITRRRISTPAVMLLTTCLTLVTVGLLGTKSGVVVIAILLLWRILLLLRVSPASALAFIVVVGTVVAWFAVEIFLALGPYLVGWDRLSYFIEQYDPLTALTGGRFLLIAEIAGIIGNFGPFQWVFGMGFDAFWSAVGKDSVESDAIDLLGGGGFLAFGWFYGLLGAALSVCIRRHSPVAEWGGAIVALILYSIFVGHVAFAATPAITTAVILASIVGERRHAHRADPVMVR